MSMVSGHTCAGDILLPYAHVLSARCELAEAWAVDVSGNADLYLLWTTSQHYGKGGECVKKWHNKP